jgi:hypothetical protein
VGGAVLSEGARSANDWRTGGVALRGCHSHLIVDAHGENAVIMTLEAASREACLSKACGPVRSACGRSFESPIFSLTRLSRKLNPDF